MNRIVFELTNRCNLQCTHCLREKSSEARDLPISLIDRIMQQAKDDYQVGNCGFTGGEPLLYPDLEKLLELLNDHDMIFSLVSNGHLVTKRIALFKRPEIKRRIEHFAISLDGPDADVHDSIRGPGAFKKAMAAILALKAAEIPVVIKYTVGRHNIDGLEQTAISLSHLEVKRIEFALTMPTPDNVAAGLIPSPEEYRQAESTVNRLAREMKTWIAINAGTYIKQSFFTCSSLAMMDFYVDVKGRLCLCCMLPGMRGDGRKKSEPEVAADLNDYDLCAAHKKLISIITGFQRKRLDKISNGDLDEIEHFQCMACARHFGKMDWLDSRPDNPWSRASGKKRKKT